MATGDLRRALLWSFLGFLALTALLAIGTVLRGDHGETGLRILGGRGMSAAVVFCAVSGAAWAERRQPRLLGMLGIAVAAVAAIATARLIWYGRDTENEWRLVVWLCTAAIACAHAELLWLPRLPARFRWVQTLATTAIGALAAMICLLTLDGYDQLARPTGVASILVALGAIAGPVFARMDAGARAPRRLLLHHERDDLWRDATGASYRVQPVAPPERG